MKRVFTVALFLALLSAAPFVWRARAQTSTPGSFAQYAQGFVSGPLSSCPAPNANLVIQCAVTGVGLEQSVNGAPYASVMSQGALSFTATATSLPAGSQPTASVQGTALTFGIPAGATGAQGIPGIPQAGQSFSQKCPAFVISGGTTTTMSGTGCTASIP